MTNTVCKKDMCCGCNACVSICPKHCISLVDENKYLNAYIDKKNCISCGLCEKVCQVCQPSSKLISLKKSFQCFEGVTKNREINNCSSSGGFATTLGMQFVKSGGYVVGIKNDHGSFSFDLTNKSDDIFKFSGSKYVKVNTKDIFERIKKLLNEDKKVLFFGLPCQIAGLKLYLLKEYENLYLVDLICHGTPSFNVLLKYLKEENCLSFVELKFREKHQFNLFVDNRPIIARRVSDPYTIGFLKGLFYTNNCYYCHFAKEERIGDITIGDSWGAKNSDANLSLILKNSEKANYLFKLIENDFELKTADYENAIIHNNQLKCPSRKQKYTDYYFNHFNNKTTKEIVRKAYPKIMMKQTIKRILVKLHLI